MASLGEIGEGLNKLLDKAVEADAALRTAAELADDTQDLLKSADEGSLHGPAVGRDAVDGQAAALGKDDRNQRVTSESPLARRVVQVDRRMLDAATRHVDHELDLNMCGRDRRARYSQGEEVLGSDLPPLVMAAGELPCGQVGCVGLREPAAVGLLARSRLHGGGRSWRNRSTCSRPPRWGTSGVCFGGNGTVLAALTLVGVVPSSSRLCRIF